MEHSSNLTHTLTHTLVMKIQLILLLNLLSQVLSESDIHIGSQYTLEIPSQYSKGFIGRAFLMEARQSPPRFRAAISVEAAMAEKFSCSLDVFLGDVRVWSSGHLSTFYAQEKCVLEFTQNGELRLKSQNRRIGWKAGTFGQGVKRLSLLKTGNLILVDEDRLIKWQSFNFPTDIMLWGQRLSSQTRLTSFPLNSTLFYSMEIQDDKIELFLNLDRSKYSYWEHQLPGKKNITYVELSTNGLGIFNGEHKFDEIKSQGPEAIRFLTLDSSTGNIRLYHYSDEKGKFEASYEALNLTCDLPLACRPYGICRTSGSCSCIEQLESGCGKEGLGLEGVCGRAKVEMVELKGVVSVLRSGVYRERVKKQECEEWCLDECECVGAEYVEELGKCYMYRIVRGMKEVERGPSRVVYMVKVVEGVKKGKGHSLKLWVIIVVPLVDAFILFLVFGGSGYYAYVFWKRRNNLPVRPQPT